MVFVNQTRLKPIASTPEVFGY